MAPTCLPTLDWWFFSTRFIEPKFNQKNQSIVNRLALKANFFVREKGLSNTLSSSFLSVSLIFNFAFATSLRLTSVNDVSFQIMFWICSLVFFRIRQFPASFSFFLFVFSTVNVFITKFCQWLDLSRGSLVSEAAALPTEPQPHDCLVNPRSVSHKYTR